MRQEKYYQTQSSQGNQRPNNFEKVQIFIELLNLRTEDQRLDLKTYTQIDVSEKNSPEVRTLRTEEIEGTVSPKYTKSIEINHYFQKEQRLCFKVYQSGKLFAKIQELLIHIIQNRTSNERQLKNQRNQVIGKLRIRVEAYDVKDQEKYFEGELKFFKIPQQGFCLFKNPQVFFQICRKQQKLPVYRSQIILDKHQNNQNEYKFKSFSIQEHKLCRNIEQMVLQVNLYYKRILGSNLLIGSTQFTLKDVQKRQMYVLKSQIEKKKHCQMMFIKAQRHGKNTLVNQFIKNGLSCCCAIAIDFTHSNGDPTQASSLHNINNPQKNKYIECLKQCLEIIWQYDQDKHVPLLGFGSCIKNHPKFKNLVSHLFPLNMNWDDMNVHSVQQAINVYKKCLGKLKFGDPTYFKQILEWAKKQCQKIAQKGKNQYMVLFFFTDGQIHDKLQVIQLLIECNYLPISVVIIGIGQADFTLMRELDDDNMNMVNKEGKRTQRDLVQFVEYNKHNKDKNSLVAQVLQQIPRQILDYISLKQKKQRSTLNNSKK